MWKIIFPQIDKYYAARSNMVKTQIIDREITDAATIKALSKVPRHLFVPKENINNAYADCPMPSG